MKEAGENTELFRIFRTDVLCLLRYFFRSEESTAWNNKEHNEKIQISLRSECQKAQFPLNSGDSVPPRARCAQVETSAKSGSSRPRETGRKRVLRGKKNIETFSLEKRQRNPKGEVCECRRAQYKQNWFDCVRLGFPSLRENRR